MSELIDKMALFPGNTGMSDVVATTVRSDPNLT
jgi:hypothetical protein